MDPAPASHVVAEGNLGALVSMLVHLRTRSMSGDGVCAADSLSALLTCF